MEARRSLIIALSLLTTFLSHPFCAAEQGHRVTTENFVVIAPDSRLAHKIGKLAEQYRRDLSLQWLGYEISPWRDKCPIYVQVGRHAGGETSFAFVNQSGGKGYPVDWQMKIFGPPDRLLDAVLPHEITHTIFATHFGRPLPRWADEGACTTVEHASEREKNHRMLIDFLTSKPSRGIPFNRMFVMRDYPRDILPLYAQGYSLAKFLIHQKGRRHFIKYVDTGLKNERPGHELRGWNQATREHYGFRDLSELQIQWLTWVRNGSDPEAIAGLAMTSDGAKPAASTDKLLEQLPETQLAEFASAEDSWYAQQSLEHSPARIAAQKQSVSSNSRTSVVTPPKSPDKSATIWR